MSRSTHALGPWLAALALLAPGYQAKPPAELGLERPLGNDLVLPTDARAQAEIERGDRAWSEGRSAAAFDAWRAALELSEGGQSVALVSADTAQPRPFGGDDATNERRTEGVAYAVLRRLSALAEADRSAWRERFAALSEESIARAGTRRERLRRVERELPFTEAALRAALRLCDLALEEGLVADATAWLERARRHTGGLAPSSDLAQRARRALELRGRVLPAAGRAESRRPAVWETAHGLRPVGSMRLTGPRPGRRPLSGAPFGRRVEPGAVVLADGSLVVQSPLYLARIDRQGGAQRFPFSSLEGLSFEMQPFASPAGGGWPLLPASDGRALWLVIGRTSPRAEGALACVAFDEGGLPFTRWVHGAGTLTTAGPGGAGADRSTVPELAGFTWQPGPALHAGKLFVQAREVPKALGEGSGERLWLVALDAASGRLEWKRDLGRPADLAQESAGRFAGAGVASTPGMPLAAHAGLVFVGTNAGQCALVEALDGRIAWSFKNRRRSLDRPGWPGTRRPQIGRGRTGEWRVGWAPFDSDYFYLLRWGPDLGAGVLAERPWEQGAGIDVVSSDPHGAVLLGQYGARRVVLERPPGAGERFALYLARAEAFAGAGLASPGRVLVASDLALYLFDRKEELLLLEAAPLAGGGGGTVMADGDRVWVVGEDAVWTFEAF